MLIEKEIIINNSIENTWKILGHDFAHPYKWASSVSHSEGHGKPLATTTCDERSCQTKLGDITEKLTHYSDENYHLAYNIVEGLPGMVKTASNDWRLTKIGPEKTQLVVRMKFRFQGIMGYLMQPLIKMKLSKMAMEIVEDFAYYSENGRPHPRKLKAQNQ
ncbi:MAG: SRPBCC family protein [Saprospirales bacterium]|nr:MAG: SRPBCC family protein [Saprospirales bacterium]